MRNDALRAIAAIAIATALGGCNAVLGPTAPDGHWAVLERGRFTFYVRPGSFGEQSTDVLATVLTDQFAVSVSTLGLRYDGRITLFLHNSGDEAGFGGDGDGGNHSGVAYPDTETVKSVAVPPLDGNLMSLLSHEVNHVIVHNGLGRPGTSFVNEGLASALLSERYHNLGPTSFHHWVATHPGQVPRLADLVDDDRWREAPQAAAYTTSASFLAYMISTYGAERMRAIYPASSSAFPGKFSEVYGMSLEQAESAWLTFCAGR
jgi:hypothetical protein